MQTESSRSVDANGLYGQVAEVARHGLPLAEGLELAARESRDRATRKALMTLAEATRQGLTLDQAIEQSRGAVDPAVAAIVRAGTQSGRLTEVLHALHGDSKARELVRRQIVDVIAYPSLMLLGVSGILFFTLVIVVPSFKSIFQDFGIGLPWVTYWILKASDLCVAIWKPFVMSLAMLLAAGFLVFRRSAMEPVIHRIPVLGKVIRWSTEMGALRMLGFLTEARLALPTALLHVGATSSSPSLRTRAQTAALAAERGSADWWRTFGGETDTANLASLVDVAAGPQRVSQAFFGAAQMLEGRIRAGTQQALVVLPIAMLSLVAALSGIAIIGLFLPLIKLLNDLGR